MENPVLTSPMTFSGNGTAESLLVPDASNSQIGSFQNEGVLSSGGGGAVDGGCVNSSDVEFGFQREEFGHGSLVGTVQIYERHVFLCYKTPEKWPPHVEGAEFDRLPRLLSAALSARKGDMKMKTRLTICEGEDGTDSSNGDVLIFPDMSRYRKLTHFDVDNFVEEVLVKDTEWLSGAVETLTGSYVFVCSHGSRDRRCGVCGPPLIKKFKEEIEAHGLQGQVCVSACSHIGGHKYAGNVIIFSPNVDGEVTGHWYGYISPDDVPVLLEEHIRKGEIIAHLWRGQMGLSVEDQKKAHELRLHLNGETNGKQNATESLLGNGTMNGTTGCCQGIGNTTCCQNQAAEGNPNHGKVGEHEAQKTAEKSSSKDTKGTSTWKACVVPTWFKSWEKEDTYAAIAVAAAVLTVGAAYGCYRHN